MSLFYLLAPLASLHLLATDLDLCCLLWSGHVTELPQPHRSQWTYKGGCLSILAPQEAAPLLAEHCCLLERTAPPVAGSAIG